MDFEEKYKKIKSKFINKKMDKEVFDKLIAKMNFSVEEYTELADRFASENLNINDGEEIEVDEEIEIPEFNLEPNIIRQYFNEISLYKILEPEEELQVVKRYEAGDDEAKEILITTNLRLVAKIALKYAKHGAYFLDLIQDGTIGLIKAIERFKPEKGYKLSTYATWWIKKEIIDSLKEKINSIKIPNYIFLEYQKIAGKEKMLSNYLGRKPTIKEIAQEIELSEKEIIRVKGFVENRTVTLTLSSDNGKNEEWEIEDRSTEEEIEETIDDDLRKEQLNQMLLNLSKREKLIISLYFGLEKDGEKHTFKDIGERLHISSERVRVLKERAIRKLRYAGRGMEKSL